MALSVAGCGGSDQETADPTPSTASSPTVPAGLDTTEPDKPAAADDLSSATAYAAYVARLVQYSVRTRSSEPISAEAFDQGGCSSCRNLATFVEQLKRGDYFEVGDDLDLGPLTAERLGNGVRVSGRFTYPANRFVAADGTTASSQDSKPYRLSVDTRWDAARGRWLLLDYTFQDLSKK